MRENFSDSIMYMLMMPRLLLLGTIIPQLKL
nr:MAG TPA: hypothetical protein [Caudoviricetes sp.]